MWYEKYLENKLLKKIQLTVTITFVYYLTILKIINAQIAQYSVREKYRVDCRETITDGNDLKFPKSRQKVVFIINFKVTEATELILSPIKWYWRLSVAATKKVGQEGSMVLQIQSQKHVELIRIRYNYAIDNSVYIYIYKDVMNV